MTANGKIENAAKIALRDLRSCYTKTGILASPVNFSDYWARDTFWAGLGMIATGNAREVAKVRQSLELFLKHQRADGKIPRKIALDYNGLKYLGFKVRRRIPRPIYKSPVSFFYSVDNNLLYAIAFCKFVEYTGDLDFAKNNYKKIRDALTFYVKKNFLADSLIYEAGLANWMDSVFKKGCVLYTNCLWSKALEKVEDLSAELGAKPAAELPSSSEVRKQLRKKFWLDEKGYFADNVSGYKKQKYFDLAGNLLAVAFDVADSDQAAKILIKVRQVKKGHALHPINDPKYPWWKINPITRLFGIADYHNANSWSWTEALVPIVQARTGGHEEALKNLAAFAEIVVRNKHIHETYFSDGRPFNHPHWKSAVPFAWGAGMFLWAAKLVNMQQ